MTLQPPVDAVVAIWRARLPAAVGTPAGERRPLLPVWPWLVLAGAVTAVRWLGLGAGWIGALPGGIVVGGPVAVAYWRSTRGVPARRVGLAGRRSMSGMPH